MIRPDATNIIVTALQSEDVAKHTTDSKGLSEHVHLLSLTHFILKAFEAEGINLEDVVDGIIANQTVTIDDAVIE